MILDPQTPQGSIVLRGAFQSVLSLVWARRPGISECFSCMLQAARRQKLSTIYQTNSFALQFDLFGMVKTDPFKGEVT